MTPAAVSVAEFVVADPADAWTRAGFRVDATPDAEGVCHVGTVGVRLIGRGGGIGIAGWSLRGVPDGLGDLDGIPTTAAPNVAEAAAHPNGVVAIDHVVLLSPHLTRTVESFAAVGAAPRRVRDVELGGKPMRQIFFRLGEVIVEVVGSPDPAGDGSSTLWGLTYTVADIDAAAAFLDGFTTPVKDAVQPGRRITTLHHRELGMSVRTALISAPARR